jgi:hypothetical protein
MKPFFIVLILAIVNIGLIHDAVAPNVDTLLEIGRDFEELTWDAFSKRYPKKTDQKDWYLFTGELEIVDLSQIKIYGLRQGDRAMILGQANNIDFYYDGLRANLGKRIIIGCEWLGRSTFGGQKTWNNKMYGKGYFSKGEDFLNAFPHLIYGIARSREIDYYSRHNDTFKTLVENSGLLVEGTYTTVDPKKLPKGTLTMAVITPVTAVFSTQTATLEVKIEGPVVKIFQKKDVPTAYPVNVEFTDIPQGTYIVTAKYRNTELIKQIEVMGHTQEFDMVMK